jgi:hypothetical protein
LSSPPRDDRPKLRLDGSLGPARPISAFEAAAMVERALEDSARNAAAVATRRQPPAVAVAGRGRPRLGPAARAALLVAGVSVSSYLVTTALVTAPVARAPSPITALELERAAAQAQAAALAAAALELEHLGRPRAALDRYRSLMSEPLPEPLAEEARWGIVECHRRLGSRSDEAASLRDYLEAHPGGMLRSHAESRLADLELPPHQLNTL